MIAAIVSVLGAGFLAMLFFFMRGIRADIAQLRTEMRFEIQALRAEMQQQIGALRTEIQVEIGALRTEMQVEFAAVRGELQAMRADIAVLQQTASRHDGILSEQSRRLGIATS